MLSPCAPNLTLSPFASPLCLALLPHVARVAQPSGSRFCKQVGNVFGVTAVADLISAVSAGTVPQLFVVCRHFHLHLLLLSFL